MKKTGKLGKEWFLVSRWDALYTNCKISALGCLILLQLPGWLSYPPVSC